MTLVRRAPNQHDVALVRALRAEVSELVRLLDTLVRPWLAEHAPEKVAEWRTLTRFAKATPVADETSVAVTTTPTSTPTPVSTEAHAA